MILYQTGGKITGTEYTFSGRPDSTYKKDAKGNWYIKNAGTNGAYTLINDPTGQRTAILNKGAVVKGAKPMGALTAGVTKVSGIALQAAKQANANSGAQVEKEYLEHLKKLENGIQKGYNNGRWTPHASVEGGAPTIAYGHKLQPGEDYSQGITDEEAHALLVKDYTKKKESAKNIVDKKYGAGTFAKLDSTKQILLTDYEYNTGLSNFPSFMDGVVKNDIDTMKAEYKRYTGTQELTSRNNWTLAMINKMERGGVLPKINNGILYRKEEKI